MPIWEKDERLKPLTTNFHNTYVGPEFDKVRKSNVKISLAHLHQVTPNSRGLYISAILLKGLIVSSKTSYLTPNRRKFEN